MRFGDLQGEPANHTRLSLTTPPILNHYTVTRDEEYPFITPPTPEEIHVFPDLGNTKMTIFGRYFSGLWKDRYRYCNLRDLLTVSDPTFGDSTLVSRYYEYGYPNSTVTSTTTQTWHAFKSMGQTPKGLFSDPYKWNNIKKWYGSFESYLMHADKTFWEDVDDPGMPIGIMEDPDSPFNIFLQYFYVDMKSTKYRYVHREMEREWKANAL
jgi:hypothetical protein